MSNLRELTNAELDLVSAGAMKAIAVMSDPCVVFRGFNASILYALRWGMENALSPLSAARFPHSLGAALAHSGTSAQELKQQPKAHDKRK